MYLIAGLGNPGRKYAQTRHNVGFAAIDVMAREFKIKLKKIKHKALFGEGQIGGERVLLAKPGTYMNLSGESILSFSQYYKIEPRHIIIIYDDVDLPAGRVRIRPSGSAGGHNGMKSIIYSLVSDEFPRVRIGIGAPGGDISDYVLSRFGKEDFAAVSRAVSAMPEIIPAIISEGISAAMERFNGQIF